MLDSLREDTLLVDYLIDSVFPSPESTEGLRSSNSHEIVSKEFISFFSSQLDLAINKGLLSIICLLASIYLLSSLSNLISHSVLEVYEPILMSKVGI